MILKKFNHLKIKPAAVIDYGEPFVKDTYKLEGDGPLTFICYEAIQDIVTSIKVATFLMYRLWQETFHQASQFRKLL